MLLNADVGEGSGSDTLADTQIIPYIDMANISCGAHAGDKHSILHAVKLCKKHGVSIGAHPGYADRESFGRESVDLAEIEIQQLIIQQLYLLGDICASEDVEINYVKPHGALYHAMMSDESVYRCILKTIAEFFKGYSLMILSRLSNCTYIDIAESYHVDIILEAFADRLYTSDGMLVSRSQPNAVYHKEDDILAQTLSLTKDRSVIDENGNKLNIYANTICVHGDNEESVKIVETMRKAIQ